MKSDLFKSQVSICTCNYLSFIMHSQCTIVPKRVARHATGYSQKLVNSSIYGHMVTWNMTRTHKRWNPLFVSTH